MAEKSCDACKFWIADGTLASPQRAGNEGICAAVLYEGRGRRVPFWAEDLSRATISWQGKTCLAWTKKPAGRVKIEKKRR